jgi:hypothetical protein
MVAIGVVNRSAANMRKAVVNQAIHVGRLQLPPCMESTARRFETAVERRGRGADGPSFGGYRENGASGDRSPTDQRWPNGSVKPPCR